LELGDCKQKTNEASDIKLVMQMLGVESGGYRCRCRHEQVVDVLAHGGKLVSILSSLIIPLQINVTAKLTPLI
jgi:hypothetical protein